MKHFNNDFRPFAEAIASVYGIKQEAIDAFWKANLITTAEPLSQLQPPSGDLLQELLRAPETTGAHLALAVAIRDSAALDTLIANHPSTAELAVRNLWLTHTTAEKLLADASGATQVHAGERVTAVTALDAEGIVVSGSATFAASLLDGRFNGSASTAETETADAVLDLVISGEDPNALDHRRFREALLDLVADSTRIHLVSRMAASTQLLLTSRDFDAITTALDNAEIYEDEIKAGIDAAGYAFAVLTGNDHIGPASQFGKEPVADVRRQERAARQRKSLGKNDSTADEAELMALLGFEDVASHTLLNSTTPLTQDQLDLALDGADSSTYVDWAERRMPVKASPKEVVRQLQRLDADDATAISREVGRREDPLTRCPELVLVAPNARLTEIPPRAAYALAEFITRTFSGEADKWDVLARLIADDFAGDFVMEIVAQVDAII